jgi:hypothetical protein
MELCLHSPLRFNVMVLRHGINLLLLLLVRLFLCSLIISVNKVCESTTLINIKMSLATHSYSSRYLPTCTLRYVTLRYVTLLQLFHNTTSVAV